MTFFDLIKKYEQYEIERDELLMELTKLFNVGLFYVDNLLVRYRTNDITLYKFNRLLEQASRLEDY